MAERSLKDLFYMVKKALPDQQELVCVDSDTEVHEVLEVMRRGGLSQVPVLAGTEVLGVFSYRSLAEGICKLPKKEPFKVTLPVDLFFEDLKYASIGDDISVLLDEFEIRDAVLVGSEDRLQGILTTIDALRYFYTVASPYVLIREIELSIRELIRAATSAKELQECAHRSLLKHYDDRGIPIPTCLEDMTFHDYVMLLRYHGNWEYFKRVWGGTIKTVAARLEPLPGLRNDVFHFKRELSLEEYDVLRDRRDWLLRRIRKVDAERKSDVKS